MPCYSPVRAYRARYTNVSGKRPLVFNKNDGYEDLAVDIPCGKCIGCKLEKSRQWAVRCMHEAKMHNTSCFITLTYDNDNLPEGGSLAPSHITKFFKRMRKAGIAFRYFQCGEYGDSGCRPHHHACIFGYDFPDRILYKIEGDCEYYISEELSRLWPYGFCLIGNLTFQSAAYVSRYVTKKITGDIALAHYGQKVPEYATMSRRPGIGAKYFDKFRSDFVDKGQCILKVDNKYIASALPKYYINRYDDYLISNPNDRGRWISLKASRKKHIPDLTTDDLLYKEYIKHDKVDKRLKRRYEDGA